MKRKKILLIKTYRPAPNQHITPPLGLLSLKSYIESRSAFYDIECLDMVLDLITPEEAAERIKKTNPDLAGFSSFTYEYPVMKKIIELASGKKPRPVFVMGGPHSAVDPEHTMMQVQDLDYIVIGEGENSFMLLLEHLFGSGQTLETIDGLVYRKGNRIILNEKKAYIDDVNSLPMPSYSDVDFDRYNNHIFRNMNWLRLKKYAPLFTSRSCPYECIYCHNVFGKGYRPLSAERVLEEMVFLNENYAIEEFHILDDVFNLDRDRVKKILDYLIRGKYRFRLAFPNGLRGDLLDNELLIMLKKAGAYRLVFAVESGTERIQKLIRKNVNLEKLSDIIDESHKLGFFQHGFFMLGFPTETAQEMERTVDFALKSRLHTASFFQVVPFPSTNLYKLAREVNPSFLYDSEKLLYYSDNSFYHQTYDIDLKPIQKNAYKDFYLNTRRIYYILSRIPSYRFLVQGGIYFLKYSFGVFKGFRDKK